MKLKKQLDLLAKQSEQNEKVAILNKKRVDDIIEQRSAELANLIQAKDNLIHELSALDLWLKNKAVQDRNLLQFISFVPVRVKFLKAKILKKDQEIKTKQSELESAVRRIEIFENELLKARTERKKSEIGLQRIESRRILEQEVKEINLAEELQNIWKKKE
ncbi:MAG: hypothetical protein LBE20_05800 [Deltaproteobacteria bacterium]|jgi:hypothetical protein|nr:hypothetical protein [Deltaproteobacteria bacterium]